MSRDIDHRFVEPIPDVPAPLGSARRTAAQAFAWYRVVGVRTTLPFFRWLLHQPEFLEARFDTTYLDRVLAERQGQPFVEPSARDERDAAVAATLSAWSRAHRAAAETSADSGTIWHRVARTEARRDR